VKTAYGIIRKSAFFLVNMLHNIYDSVMCTADKENHFTGLPDQEILFVPEIILDMNSSSSIYRESLQKEKNSLLLRLKITLFLVDQIVFVCVDDAFMPF
jgi:hypothetical protein